jgi:hypothetical protein
VNGKRAVSHRAPRPLQSNTTTEPDVEQYKAIETSSPQLLLRASRQPEVDRYGGAGTTCDNLDKTLSHEVLLMFQTINTL